MLSLLIFISCDPNGLFIHCDFLKSDLNVKLLIVGFKIINIVLLAVGHLEVVLDWQLYKCWKAGFSRQTVFWVL